MKKIDKAYFLHHQGVITGLRCCAPAYSNKMFTFLLCFGFFVVCQGAEPHTDIFGQHVTNWNAVTGRTLVRVDLTAFVSDLSTLLFWRPEIAHAIQQGQFQFLGALYFQSIGTNNIAEISLVTKEPAPDSLRILVFDNQFTSFDMVCTNV